MTVEKVETASPSARFTLPSRILHWTMAPMVVAQLLIGVIMIVGALTFFPAVSLGPIVEQLSHGKFF